ncbi:MarR family winged helix-turn-helix transcriptional regulator [Streptomyces sp. NPDC001276]|uniref:MarR family winged helix-turn-helix transcriptional regulator n=1 Tax=Streptomyces sp. NPDC001276 TaxID=3364555 RepID=UPI00368DFD2B
MDERTETVLGLDAAMQRLRHDRYGLYGPLVRERFLDGLPEAVTLVDYRVLRFIEASSPPPPTLSDIAAVLLVDRARAARVVDRLERDGLVTRVRDTMDQRTRRVELTEAGRRQQATAAARRTRLLGGALSEWTGEDLERLTACIERLNDSVTRHMLMAGQPEENPA